MARLTPRIRESQIDELFARRLLSDARFAAAFLALAGIPGDVVQADPQQPHPIGTGSIDLRLRLRDGTLLLVENKIDAAYSVNGAGEAQPERYQRSVEHYRARAIKSLSVLLAPCIYLRATRSASQFDRLVAYEDCLPGLSGVDAEVLGAAILQAETPYEPDPNEASGDFFAAFAAYAGQHFTELVVKRNPNAGGVRPEGSRTIYFDVQRTLVSVPHLPVPRMSLQCWDSGAASPSVKIMLGGLAARSCSLPIPPGFKQIGGYVRPAGGSLGFVIDTPRLDTQIGLDQQMGAVRTSLERTRKLRSWWNCEAQKLRL